jgi:2-keto-4-pentenoate hydratase
VQKQLGVDRPDFGVLFADMIVAEDEPVAAGRVLQPKIEAEVAFLLDRDVDVEAPTVADVLRAVAYAMPSLEIVGSRITNWDIGIVDTVADNASSGLFVMGGPVRRLDGLDLRALQMKMTRREEVVSKGTGAACLGNPLNAMAWLAGELATRKRPLRAGDVVLSGALGPMVQVNPGDVFEANIAHGLGTIRIGGRKQAFSKTRKSISQKLEERSAKNVNGRRLYGAVGREATRCKRRRKCMDEGGFFAKIVKGDLPQAPITKLLGWKFLEFDASQQVIKVEMQARPEFINPADLIHGGMLAAMLDETLSPALAATLGPGEFAPTLEIEVNFITPVKVGRVLGTVES